MSDNLPAPTNSSGSPATSSGGSVAQTAGAVVGTVVDMAAAAIRYSIMLARLTAAAVALRGVGSRVRETYAYVGDCAKTVDHLADLAASLTPAVDPDTVGEHRQAAGTMRGCLARAKKMADTVDTMSTTFEQARRAHEADYGPVAQTAQNMPVPMANRNFYRNR